MIRSPNPANTSTSSIRQPHPPDFPPRAPLRPPHCFSNRVRPPPIPARFRPSPPIPKLNNPGMPAPQPIPRRLRLIRNILPSLNVFRGLHLIDISNLFPSMPLATLDRENPGYGRSRSCTQKDSAPCSTIPGRGIAAMAVGKIHLEEPGGPILGVGEGGIPRTRFRDTAQMTPEIVGIRR
jgi:hypothetical protein